MGEIIYGKPIAEAINARTAAMVAELKSRGTTPTLAIVLVGDDRPSMSYVARKRSAAESLGVGFELCHLPSDVDTHRVIDEISRLQSNRDISGLIVQLPLPDHINTAEVLAQIDPDLDVDGLTEASMRRLETDDSILPPTPAAILDILESLQIDLKARNIAILGNGPLVGRPLSIILRRRGSNVTVCDSQTKNTAEICRQSDVIISGVGKKHLITADMISAGSTIIDAGAESIDGKIFGDADLMDLLPVVKYITPVPGGVGPITVAELLRNTVILAKKNHYDQSA